MHASAESIERIYLGSALADQIHDGILAVDREQTIRYANTTLCQFLGYQSLEGRPLSCLLLEADRGAHRERVDEFFRSPVRREMNNALQVQMLHQDGSTSRVSIGLSLVHSSATPGGAVASAVIRLPSPEDG